VLGTAIVQTDGGGNAFFSFRFATAAALQNGYFTGAATDAAGNTSEFAPQSGAVALGNVSARAFVGPGDNVLIGGFIVRSQPQGVAVRALGPSLRAAGALADPTLELYDANQTLIASNDDWDTSGSEDALNQLGLTPSAETEAVILPVCQIPCPTRCSNCAMLPAH
jgi:hypothetical protein